MYNHNQIEKKWEKFWDENKTFKFHDNINQEKFYILDMFPYPSGKGLHVGHPKGYTGTDVISRFKRLKGFNVLHPIGWDAFGLPAEQYALKTNNHPEVFTLENINNFRSQLKRMGFDFDYDKEVNTTDPQYFQWTQWIFLQFYKHGLAEIKEIDVNWCPQLGTVLANEEVILDKQGNRVSEVGGFPVVKKPMRQWVLKITAYADKLLEGLDEINWPSSLKSLQTNWIGKTDGLEIEFSILDQNDKLKIFTSRPDSIYGATFLAVCTHHPLLDKLTTNSNKENVSKFVADNDLLTDMDLKVAKQKLGVFTGSYAIHPLTNQKLPIYVANYVLNNVGCGAIMGVPAHDENDYDFANALNIEIKPIIQSDNLPFIGDGKHINSDFLNGFNNEEAFKLASEKLINMKIANYKTNYKLRDWVFSRQRYWGEPFPVLFDENMQILLDEELPILLPKLKEFKPSGTGESPLLNAKEWLELDKGGQRYLRDTNTMPQWAGSCWYYLGYILKNNDDQSYTPLNSPEAKERFKRWLPVDIYVGGQEHAVLHLLYARFWHRFLYDIGIVPTKEPFFTMVNQGIILGPDNEKMSKSKGNIISVDDVIESHGADALRLYEMFMGPFTSSMAWNNEALDGVRKWLDRIYRLYFNHDELGFKVSNKLIEVDPELASSYHRMLKQVEIDIEKFHFNTAISEMMIFINDVYKQKIFNIEMMHNFAIVLSCFAPHLAEEINEYMQYNSSICLMQWPQYDQNKTIQSEVKIPIVINKKPRDILVVPFDTSEDKLLQLALNSPKAKQFIGNKPIKQQVIVKNKIINLII